MKNSLLVNFPNSVKIYDAKMDIQHTPIKITTNAFEIKVRGRDSTFQSQKFSVICLDGKKQDLFTIKNNIELLVEHILFPIEALEKYDFHFLAKNIPIKAVVFDNNVIAIGNTNETRFLTTKDLKQSAINKDNLLILLSSLIYKKTEDTMKEFSANVQSFMHFLDDYKHFLKYSNTEEIKRLNEALSKVSSMIKKE